MRTISYNVLACKCTYMKCIACACCKGNCKRIQHVRSIFVGNCKCAFHVRYVVHALTRSAFHARTILYHIDFYKTKTLYHERILSRATIMQGVIFFLICIFIL